MREEWTRPEVEEFDIAERTQLDGGPFGDAADPRGSLFDRGEGGEGEGGGGAPSS